MKDYIVSRVMEIADFILASRSTVRAAAKEFNVSKSTVHKDMTERLLAIDKDLHEKIGEVLAENKAERHIRGGMATKEKYLNGKSY